MKLNNLKTVKKKSVMSPVMLLLFAILVIYTICLIAPLLWGVLTSLKGKYDFRSNIFGLPKKWLFSNYTDAFQAYAKRVPAKEGGFEWVTMGGMIVNSALYSLGCSLVRTLCTCLVAYVTAKFSKFFFSKVVYYLVIVVMILPIVGSMPSELALARSLGLYDHIWGMWVMQFNFLGAYYLVFHAMFKGVPKDFAEAAYIDGASEFTVLVRIMLPMVKSTFFIIVLLYFIGYWNDYQTPMLYIPSHPTMANGLHSFSQSTDNALATIPMKLTGCMLMLLPILVLFLIFHNKMLGNISMGGLKE